jgi:hypothetical protein
MLPEAVSEALGISLSEVLDLYFGELDEVRRGRLIGEALDRRMMGEWDQEWLDEESRRREAAFVSPYREDSVMKVTYPPYLFVASQTSYDFCAYGHRSHRLKSL